MNNKRIQQRGICPVCGGEYATKNGYMVAHGYTLKLGPQTNHCAGVDAPHFGSEEARQWIACYIVSLGTMRNVADKPRPFEQAIKYMHTRLEQWKLAELREVDVDIEEAEQRKAREAAAEAKKLEKAAKEKKRIDAKAEREAKTAAKWAKLCSVNNHQIELDGEVIVEWQSTYNSRTELERDHYKRAGEYLAKAFDDVQDRIDASWRLIRRIRELESNKQLHKF